MTVAGFFGKRGQVILDLAALGGKVKLTPFYSHRKRLDGMGTEEEEKTHLRSTAVNRSSHVLTADQRLYFRDELRAARARALLNAEGFEPIIVALERLGSLLHPTGRSLGDYHDVLLTIARDSTHGTLDGCMPEVISSLDSLYKNVRVGRNQAVHEGAHARHLVRHCVELALAVEGGLMKDHRCVADFMVRAPVCSEIWQQVAFARQQMLVNSFSYLPVKWLGKWVVVSDGAIARYLAKQADADKALKRTLESAVDSGELGLEPAFCVRPEAAVLEVICSATENVVLITTEDEGALLGIATFFDFL